MKSILTLLTTLLLATPLPTAPPAPCGSAGDPITLLTYRDDEWYGSTF